MRQISIRKPQPPATPAGAIERFILVVALVLPLALILLGLTLLPTIGLAAPTSLVGGDVNITANRPAPSQPAPPPTLVPPTLTPEPTPTPQPAADDAPLADGLYTVKPGDELKNIASAYGLSIQQLVTANNIPDPDSLRVGQVLRIPDN